jgi:PAS domain S-box-containing protein
MQTRPELPSSTLPVVDTDWYWEQDTSLRYTVVVPAAHVRDRAVDQYIGRRRWELAGARALSASWDDHRALLDARQPFSNFEYLMSSADGSAARCMCCSGEPRFDEHGEFIGYAGSTRDISDEWPTTQRLRHRLSTTLESLSDGFAILDRDWRIRYGNPVAFEMLGKGRTVVGRRLWDVFEGLEGSPFERYYRRAMEEGVPGRFEAPYAPMRMWFRVSVWPCEEGIAISFTDVTAAREAQDRLVEMNAVLERRVQQRTMELEAANKDLQAFAYTLAHDIRAPLAAVEGFSRALQESSEQELGPRSRHFMQRIRSAAAEMNNMTEGILSLSRLASTPLQEKPVDLGAMATRQLQVLGELQPGRNVAVVVPEGLWASADPFLIELAMQNLLQNAWKYTRGRDPATIEVGMECDEGGTRYFVRDNGVGFESREAARLFEPFCRLHGAAFEGAGIGLATVQRVIRRHGGRVWAHSQPDLGATFYFTLQTGPAGC